MHARRLSLFLTLPFVLAACPSDDAGEGETDDGTTTAMTTAMTTLPSSSSSTTASTSASTTETTGPTTTETTTTGESDTDTSSSTGVPCDPMVVELPGDTFFPEGIAAHSDGTMYVGSLGTGEIVHVTLCPESGEEYLVEQLNDGADTTAAVGLVVDETNNVVWVCNSDFAGVMPPAIQGFNLDDGTLVATHAFAGGVCNDLAFDGAGNLYGTESFASVIMRVAAADLMSDMDAEVWSNDSMYEVGPGEFGLNGIVWDGVDAMFTVNLTTGELYETPILGNGDADNPNLVDLGGTMLVGPDGLELEAADTFVVVENAAPALTRITLAAAGNTVEVIDDMFDVPTTAAIIGPNAWVVESQLDHLMDPMGAGPPELPFVLVRRTL